MIDVDTAREAFARAYAALDSAPPLRPIQTAGEFDAALASARPGSVLLLHPCFVYAAPLTLRMPLTLHTVPDAVPLGRVDDDALLPEFQGGVTVAADDVALVGIAIRHTNPNYAVLTLHGARTLVDRCLVLGDSRVGSRRGIEANGNGDVRIFRCYVDSGPGTYPSATGGDYQAVCTWNMAPGLLLEDNYLCGAGETFMAGGADAPTADRMPANITIRGNTITAKAEWMAMPVQRKNILELKAARNVTIEHNDLSWSWGGHGQDGYGLMLTVRNQSGHAPWSTVQDVVVADNTWSAMAAAVNILAVDDHYPTACGRLARVQIVRNTFTAMDPLKYTATATPGSKKMIQIGQGPESLTIADNVFEGQNLTSNVFFYGSNAKCRDLHIDHNRWPKTTYGIFGNACAVGDAAWTTYVDGASSTRDGNIIA